MLSQAVSHPIILFLILMVISIFLFATVRFLMQTLYTRTLCRWHWLAARIDRLTTNGAPLMKKYGALGLVLFVALPVPGTGVVGGAVLSSLAGLKWYTSFLAVIAASAIENLVTAIGIAGLIRLVHG